MGHKYSREQILEGALAASFDDGLSRLTFGRLAKNLGISDRMIVYYFPTKDELLTEVVMALGTELQAKLGEAFTAPVADHRALLAAAWPVVTTPAADRVFALFFEANGLATAGREPYASLVAPLVAAWIEWTEQFIDAPPEQRRTEAETAVAVLDGLLLLRQLASPEAADRAAATLGLR